MHLLLTAVMLLLALDIYGSLLVSPRSHQSPPLARLRRAGD
jgi:hypothetical protein